jgi:hypothetical protein
MRKTNITGFYARPPRGFSVLMVAVFRPLSVHRYPHGTHPPTRDFDKWDGELFVYTPRRARRKKQKPVSFGDTPRVTERHIRKGSGGASVCIAERHIGESPKCVADRHISRIASPTPKLSLIQGSSMARAPVQAGDAGSNPAPVASLTAVVVAVVKAELDELDARRQAA